MSNQKTGTFFCTARLRTWGINVDQLLHYFKICLDCISLGVALGALAKVLPPIAALLSIVWTSIQIYIWWKKRRDNHRR